MDIQEMKAHANDGLPFRISLEAVNKGVGLVALGLPFALLLISGLGNTCAGIDSISHYYYSRLGGDVLVGALCFIGLLLMFFYRLPSAGDGQPAPVDGYLGHGKWDMLAARLAGLGAFGVALAPTGGKGCEDFGGQVARVFLKDTQGGHLVQPPGEPVTGTPSFDFWATLGVDDGLLTLVHYGSALVMFLVLAYYALVVFPRPQSATAFDAEGDRARTKTIRNGFYRLFGGLILVAVLALIYKFFVIQGNEALLAWWNARNLTFWFEALGLVAFGLSWSLKGRLFAIFRDRGEADPRVLAN